MFINKRNLTIKKILVPVDYSESSLNALESAIYIAQRHNATLQIIHIRDILLEKEHPYPPDNAKDFFNAMAGNLMMKYGVKTDVTFPEGIVGHVIVKTVPEKKIDLVVMGSHGESGPRDFFIGSNAYYVVKKATCPVLLIPAGKKWKEFETLLLPATPALFSSKIHHFIYEFVKYNTRKCTLHLLNVGTDKKAAGSQWQSDIIAEIKNNDLSDKIAVTFSIYVSPDIAKSVLLTAKQIKADIVVIPPALDMVTNPFFVGPFSQKIIGHARVPVLSILRNADYH